MQGMYVLSTIGESPSILTELLWWLCTVERRPVAGIEVWATGRGARRVRALATGAAWRALQDRTGPLPALQPDGAAAEGGYGFRIHMFAHRGRVLHDVRSEGESASVSATLHDRVRELRSSLPDRIPILGCLAGGRKTVSAALHTAFCLQAGASDRLVHAVIDATLEAALRDGGRLDAYAFPDEEWAELSHVPVSDQVTVYDVPFPRMRFLVPRRLSEVLETLPWDEVWPTLDANMGRHARGMLFRRGVQTWLYEVRDEDSGRVLYTTRLSRRAGAALAAMACSAEGATAADITAWLDANEVGWAPPTSTGNDELTRARAVRSAATALRKELEDIPVGLERLGPPATGFSISGVHVSCAWPPARGPNQETPPLE